jgi:hypothetical protein
VVVSTQEVPNLVSYDQAIELRVVRVKARNKVDMPHVSETVNPRNLTSSKTDD